MIAFLAPVPLTTAVRRTSIQNVILFPKLAASTTAFAVFLNDGHDLKTSMDIKPTVPSGSSINPKHSTYQTAVRSVLAMALV